MKNKYLFITSILLITSLVGCKDKPSPTPEPEPTPVVYPIDFDFNPSENNYLVMDKGTNSQVQIKFKETSHYSNYDTITWSINNESQSYIEISSETFDHMMCQIKAKEKTPLGKPATLTVTIVNKDKTITKTKDCSIYIFEGTPIEAELVHKDDWYSYQYKSAIISKGSRYKFTATRDSAHNFTYFGMSNYAGDVPYFTVGYKNNTSKITVYKVSKAGNPLIFGTNQLWQYSKELIVVNNSLFNVNDVINIECIINEDIDTTTGIWAYIGSY